MRLLSLRLQNFRQHVDTRLTFERGLTGIIGPNGSGKSTILEAIAWALYGTPAARGTRESIRFSRAAPRAPVRVELDFELAGHRYRVVRGLSSAECHLDGGDTPIASTITGVSELMQRRLGMTRTEFFHTYFTGQKELDVMAALGAADRARFLSRVLGYDRLSGAQALIRDRRRLVTAEAQGLRQGRPDPVATRQTAVESEARVQAAGEHRAAAEREVSTARAARQALEPQWQSAQATRDRWQQLTADARVLEGELAALDREADTVERELAALGAVRQQVQPWRETLATLPALQAELEALETLAAGEARRQALMARVQGVVDESGRLGDRLARLATAPALEREAAEQLAGGKQALGDAERALEDERTAWTRDRQEAETRLEALRTQYAELAQQLEALEGLGAESPCPTCGRPLGEHVQAVVSQLRDQLDTVRLDGNYYRQRVDQLKTAPAAVAALEATRQAAQQEVTAVERRAARIQAALAEATTVAAQQTEVEDRRQALVAELDLLPVGYEVARHTAVRDAVQERRELAMRVARADAQLERESALQASRTRLIASGEETRARLRLLEAERDALATRVEVDRSLQAAVDAATLTLQRAEIALAEAVTALAHAEAMRTAAIERSAELARVETALEALDAERAMHEALDDAFGELRATLTAQVRPELAELASGFLESLTDGRYRTLEFDEDYQLVVLEDGLPKPVISGGEEDLCNLVLRLAISQMIAERAGQAFSLLILDEVFGSLDDARRSSVIALLRRLNDRFEQVIVITHIEQVRDGLDRLVQLRFDEARGCSEVVAA